LVDLKKRDGCPAAVIIKKRRAEKRGWKEKIHGKTEGTSKGKVREALFPEKRRIQLF